MVSACFCVCGLFTPAAGAGIRSVPSLTARVVSHARAVNRRSVLLNGFGEVGSEPPSSDSASRTAGSLEPFINKQETLWFFTVPSSWQTAWVKNSETEEKRLGSKSDIVAQLLTEGDRWCRWVEGLPDAWLSEQVRMPGGGSKSLFEMLVGPKEHEMDHRGQLMVIERLLGIVPHLTRNRQGASQATAKSAS